MKFSRGINRNNHRDHIPSKCALILYKVWRLAFRDIISYVEVAYGNVSVSKEGQFIEALYSVCVKEDDKIKEWHETSLVEELGYVVS